MSRQIETPLGFVLFTFSYLSVTYCFLETGNWLYFGFWFLSCFSAGQIVPDPASDKDEDPEILTDPESEDEDPASEEDENPEFLADPALEEDEVDPAIGADPDSEELDPAIGAEPEDYSLTTYVVVLVLQ